MALFYYNGDQRNQIASLQRYQFLKRGGDIVILPQSVFEQK
jgi:hypothetical protein